MQALLCSWLGLTTTLKEEEVEGLLLLQSARLAAMQ